MVRTGQTTFERMKTIGDAYPAVAGLPGYLERQKASHREQWLCRTGIHTAQVIGSVVGVRTYVYDILGPA